MSNPVDVRVPFHVLKSVTDYLETQNIDYSAMIEDLQVAYKIRIDPGVFSVNSFAQQL